MLSRAESTSLRSMLYCVSLTCRMCDSGRALRRGGTEGRDWRGARDGRTACEAASSNTSSRRRAPDDAIPFDGLDGDIARQLIVHRDSCLWLVKSSMMHTGPAIEWMATPRLELEFRGFWWLG